MIDYSVIVAGGGPAGALAALKLARAGTRVLVVDRERPARVEAAEILAPEGRAILDREDLWTQIPPGLLRPCSRLAVAWESADPVWTSFAHHRSGYAWHVDRMRFDAWLKGRLKAAGIAVVEGSVNAVHRNDDGWCVAFRAGGRQQLASSRCLILATGRSSHAFGLARRQRIDTLCLVSGLADPDPVEPDALVVEAAADGWWYSAPLINGRLFAGWMTDLSLVQGTRRDVAAALSLVDAPLHARRIGTPHLATVVGSAAWTLSPAAGPGWIAIGDARLARDPISGDGLTAALGSACEGADVVMRALAGDASVWTEAARHTAEVAADYRQRRLNLYRVAARRWPSSPFWQRFGQ